MKKSQIIFYGVLGAITLGVVTPMSIWSSLEEQSSSSEQIATLKVDSSARKEYLLGEKFSAKGLSFFAGEKEIEIEDSMIKYDFSTAGKKKVEISYVEGTTTYTAKHYVEVFSVNNLDVSGYNNMYIDSNGKCVVPGLTVIANLSGPANEFQKDPRYPDYDKCCFILSPENYTISATQSSSFESYYNVVLTAGGDTFGWVYSAKEFHPDVSSTDRILKFETEDENNNKTLTLFVQKNSNSFTGLGVGKNTDVTGTYVLRDNAFNTIVQFGFSYRVETWSSSFKSSEYGQGVKDSIGYGSDGAAMKVEIEGEVYYAPGTSWHKAVLGG